MTKKVIVVGSGFGGLASALRLKAKNYDVTLIVTDHNNINYSQILKNSKLIFDCRNKLKVNKKKVNAKIIQV